MGLSPTEVAIGTIRIDNQCLVEVFQCFFLIFHNTVAETTIRKAPVTFGVVADSTKKVLERTLMASDSKVGHAPVVVDQATHFTVQLHAEELTVQRDCVFEVMIAVGFQGT